MNGSCVACVQSELSVEFCPMVIFQEKKWLTAALQTDYT